jgi:hypothetical protein
MSISNETLQAMIRSYHGFALTDDELELVRPELENYLQEVEKLRELDLANVMSGRLLRAQEGGNPDGGCCTRDYDHRRAGTQDQNKGHLAR